MWTKIKGFISAVAGVILTLATMLFIALLGVLMAFVGYFLLWGLLGVLILSFIAFLIYCAITEKKVSRS